MSTLIQALETGVKPRSLQTALVLILEDGYHFVKFRNKYHLAVPNLGHMTGNRAMTNKLWNALLPSFKFSRKAPIDGITMDVYEPIDEAKLRSWLEPLEILIETEVPDTRKRD